ncbi:MAG: TIGR02186 family protein [Acidobacteriota bacterium]
MYTLSRMRNLLLSLLICVPVLLAAQTGERDENPILSIEPESIHINAFYKGTDLIARADLPAGCDAAVLKIQGNPESINLKRKGRVSIFWLNVDDVVVSNAPEIYILNSSASLEDVCTAETQQMLQLGYEALNEQVDIRGEKAQVKSEFTEFIKLKEHYGFYRQTTTATLHPGTGKNNPSFEAVLRIPPVMPSGDYQVRLYYFKNRILLGESHSNLSVEKVGVPKYLYSLAFNHPAFYGLFACVIAMATGILMGLIFGSRKRKKR